VSKAVKSLPVALAMTILASVLVATAAAPAGAAPVEPLFPDQIDAYSEYDGADTCSDYDKPGATMLRDLLEKAYPGTQGYISRECSSGGSSEHHEGRAIDWMVSAQTERPLADDLFAWLLAKDAYTNTHAMVRRLGIMYIIWDRQIWRAYSPEDGWQPYNGSNPHTDHVHISMSWDGALEDTTWTTKQDLGGRLDQARFTASWYSRGRVDVFRRGLSGDLEQRTWQSGWSGWVGLGGDLQSGPTAVWSSKRSLWVFAQGTDGTLHKRRWRAGVGWRDWRFTGVPISAAPAVASRKGRIDLVVRTPSGSVAHRARVNGKGWSQWEDLGGVITAPPAAVWTGKHRLDVFARGSAAMLHQNTLTGGTWSGWTNLGGVLTSGPAAESIRRGEVSVYVRTERGSISERHYVDSWSGWTELGGRHVSAPAATGIRNVRADLFARHPAGGLYQNYYFPKVGSWSGWVVQ